MPSFASVYNLMVTTLVLLLTVQVNADPVPYQSDPTPPYNGNNSYPIPKNPFSFKPAFTKILTNGPTLSVSKLPFLTGNFNIVPLSNAPGSNHRVQGPLLNGTVLGGGGAGLFESDGEYGVREALEWGVSDDGEAFWLTTKIISTADGSRVSIVVSCSSFGVRLDVCPRSLYTAKGRCVG